MNTGKTACLALGALMALAGTAMADIVAGGVVGAATSGNAGARYRSFNNSTGRELYVGKQNLGTGGAANRSESANFAWSSPTTTTFSYTWNPATQTQAAGMAGLGLPNPVLYNSTTAGAPVTYTSATWNYFEIAIKNNQAGYAVSLSNVYFQVGSDPAFLLGSGQFGDNTVAAGGTGTVKWGITNLGDLKTLGFTITGNIDLIGIRAGGAEAMAVDFSTAQVTLVPLPPAAWAGLGSLAGVAGFGMIRRRKNAAL